MDRIARHGARIILFLDVAETGRRLETVAAAKLCPSQFSAMIISFGIQIYIHVSINVLITILYDTCHYWEV